MIADPFSPERAVAAIGLLAAFRDAEVLGSADVHTAATIGGLVAVTDDAVLLAAALAVRAVRLGHVYVDLATIASTATVEDAPAAAVEVDTDVTALDWPAFDGWTDLVAASGIATIGDRAASDRPLRLVGSHLYLDRYWRHERHIIEDLRSRAEAAPPPVDADRLASGAARLFPIDVDQRLAATTAVERRLAVVAGGPGTGKTTTVARLLALVLEQAAAQGEPPPRIALAAPTGKASARLAEAVHAEAATLDTTPAIREALCSLEARTLHRLLGWRRDSDSRFRHDSTNQLPHTVVVVDETSMVPLSLMALLLQAVRPSARLVLVGDPRQLASVEAGAVLGDIVGPADRAGSAAIARSVVVLGTSHRFGTAIGAVAAAIEAGDADATVAALRVDDPGITWLEVEAVDPTSDPAFDPVRDLVTATAREVVSAAADGDVTGALEALRAVQVLCAHRRGPAGAAQWRTAVERWLRSAVPGHTATGRNAGQAVLVTKNDAGLGVFNGDTGVVVDTGEGRLRVAFDRHGEPLLVSPTRLEATEALSAMTIHKAQGSQFGTAIVVLPHPSSRALTRELLYTGITRAQHHLVLVGSEAAVRAAVSRPIARASGIRDALWT